MISTFNIIKLESFLKDFYNLTHIRITIFDENFKELVAYPAFPAPHCQIIRSDETAEKNCIRCDENACRIAKNQNGPYIYRCHAGFTEAISPIRMGNIILGYLFFGHVFSYENREEGYENICRLCRNYQIDEKRLLDACRHQPVVSKEYILSASRILEAVASYLCLDRMIVLKHQELPVQIDDYIMKHLSEKICIQDICSHFRIGKTQLCDIAKLNYGKGIAAHIRSLRIERAKELLADNPKLSISEVASACGFEDYNYFIALFTKTVGMPPKKYANVGNQTALEGKSNAPQQVTGQQACNAEIKKSLIYQRL